MRKYRAKGFIRWASGPPPWRVRWQGQPPRFPELGNAQLTGRSSFPGACEGSSSRRSSLGSSVRLLGSATDHSRASIFVEYAAVVSLLGHITAFGPSFLFSFRARPTGWACAACLELPQPARSEGQAEASGPAGPARSQPRTPCLQQPYGLGSLGFFGSFAPPRCDALEHVQQQHDPGDLKTGD
jgi:hypothetical protein